MGLFAYNATGLKEAYNWINCIKIIDTTRPMIPKANPCTTLYCRWSNNVPFFLTERIHPKISPIIKVINGII